MPDPKAASPGAGFKPGLWQQEINVRDFIRPNYTPYDGKVGRVEVPPFHQMGRFQWGKRGLNDTLTDAKAPSNELVEETCTVSRPEGLRAYRVGSPGEC